MNSYDSPQYESGGQYKNKKHLHTRKRPQIPIKLSICLKVLLVQVFSPQNAFMMEYVCVRVPVYWRQWIYTEPRIQDQFYRY